MTSNLYRHTVTGIETTLDDKFVAVFGDAFEPVKTTRKSTKKTEESDSSNDSSKEGNN